MSDGQAGLDWSIWEQMLLQYFSTINYNISQSQWGQLSAVHKSINTRQAGPEGHHSQPALTQRITEETLIAVLAWPSPCQSGSGLMADVRCIMGSNALQKLILKLYTRSYSHFSRTNFDNILFSFFLIRQLKLKKKYIYIHI